MADAKKLIRLSYKAYLADADERLYDTTDADAAKEAALKQAAEQKPEPAAAPAPQPVTAPAEAPTRHLFCAVPDRTHKPQRRSKISFFFIID